MSEEKPLEALRANYARPGKVEWIGLREARRAMPLSVPKVQAIEGKGLEGDHSSKRKVNGKRQVTLIQQEHIGAVAQILGREGVDPALLRRNVVVSGINLQGLKEQRIQIGSAVLEITGPCHPCSRMEENLGEGGYSAMRGHGGWCAKVLVSGEFGVGDAVKPE